MGVAALAAIVLVLLQPGNSQGIDALGGSSETFYGKNKGKSTEAKLKMWTYICLGVLAVLAVVFFILQYDGIWT
ncbi:MAG: preprotein translocase subunit SecG [Clostridiales bacterium]|nr:preprotein translocase subunit SecG [Clostridiales bacterium]